MKWFALALLVVPLVCMKPARADADAAGSKGGIDVYLIGGQSNATDVTRKTPPFAATEKKVPATVVTGGSR